MRSRQGFDFGLRRFGQIIVRYGPPARALQIIELPCPHGPEAGQESANAQSDGDRQEDEENVHGANPRAWRARSAFSVTRMDEPDMAPKAAQA